VVGQCGHLHSIGVAIECYGQDAIVLLGYFGFVVLAVYFKLEFFHDFRPTSRSARRGGTLVPIENPPVMEGRLALGGFIGSFF